MTSPEPESPNANPASLPHPTGDGPEKSAPASRHSTFWRWFGFALKVLVCGGLLYYVLATKLNEKPTEGMKSPKEELEALFLHSPYLLCVAIAAYAVQIMIGAQRLRFLLAAQGARLPYLTMLRLCYLGAFFDPIGFTSVGGDAVKAVYLARATPRGQRVETVSVLVLDRLMGLLGLLTLTLLVALWHLGALSANPEVQPYLKWLFMAAGFLYVGTGLLLSKKFYSIAPLQFVMHKFPGGSIFDRAYFSLQKYRHRPAALLLGLSLSLCVHTVGIVAGYVLAMGMGEDPAFGPFLVAWFISNFICSFAPFMGVGVGQWLYGPIFKSIANMEHGFVLATAVQATCMLAKLPGLLAWLVSREQLSQDAGAKKSEVKGQK